MDAKVEDRTSDRIAEIEKQIKALPDPLRAELLERAVVDIGDFELFLPCLFHIQTDCEKCVQTIMSRVKISATAVPSSGTSINEGEQFTLNVKVTNCTSHDLRNVELTAKGTTFARVDIPGDTLVRDLGDMPFLSSKNVSYECIATDETPTPQGPADTLLNLQVKANLDFRAFKTQPFQGEVLPD